MLQTPTWKVSDQCHRERYCGNRLEQSQQSQMPAWQLQFGEAGQFPSCASLDGKPPVGDVRPQQPSKVWTLTQEAARTPIPAEMDIDELQDSEVQVPQSGSVMSPGDMMEDPAWVF